MNDTDEIDLPELNVKIWNHTRMSTTYIQDEDLAKTIGLIMSTNDARWYPVKNMGIISIGAIDWREYTPVEQDLVKEVKLLLFLASIAKTGILDRGVNTGHHMATSENFDVLYQRFTPGQLDMATRGGFIVREWHAGYQIDEVKFYQPESTPKPMTFWSDQKLLNKMMRVRKRNKKVYNRILRATDAFMQANYNDEKLSHQARILLQTSAYEILFELNEGGQRKALKQYFRDNFVLPSDPLRTYRSERPVSSRFPKGYEIERRESIKVKWADSFYSLRNKIIHGGKVPGSSYLFENHQLHFDIARLFFVLGIKKEIGKLSYIKESNDRILWKNPPRPTDPFDLENWYIGFVYDVDIFEGLRIRF